MIPSVPRMAKGRMVWNAPRRILISPTKPFSPGSPAEDIVADQEQKAVNRHRFPQPAEIGQHAGVASVVEHADHQEQGAGVSPWLTIWRVAPAIPPCSAKDAEHHEAEVRHR